MAMAVVEPSLMALYYHRVIQIIILAPVVEWALEAITDNFDRYRFLPLLHAGVFFFHNLLLL